MAQIIQQGFSGRSLGDMVDAFSRGKGQAQLLRQNEQALAQGAAEMARQQQMQALVGQAFGGAPAPAGTQLTGQGAPVAAAGEQQVGVSQAQAMAQLAVQFPEQFEAINKNLGLISDQQKTEAADFAFKMLNTPAERRGELIQQRVAQLTAQGRNPSDTAELMDLSPEDQDQALQAVQVAALSPEKRLELAQKGEITPLQAMELDIKRQTLDIRREENRQRGLDRAIAAEDNAIKREQLQLQVDESKRKVEQAKRESEFAAESAINDVTSTSDTIDRLLEGDALEKAAGFSSQFPTVPGTDAANFEATLETLKSQAFLSQVQKMQGLGALSEAEGNKLGQAIGSLSLSMSDKALRAELGRIKATLDQAKGRLERKHGVKAPEKTPDALSDDELLRELGL